MLKRIEDHELGESTSRRVGYHATTDYAKSSRATCRRCENNIEQDELRLALMLQDIEGYKSTAWMHFDCFWKHPETKKLSGTNEIHNLGKLKAIDRKRISDAFDALMAKKDKTSKKRKTNDDEDEDEYVPDSTTKRVTRARKKRSSSSSSPKKRKQNLEEN